MPFVIDDAVIEAAAETIGDAVSGATTEATSDIASSGLGLLEDVSETSLSEEFPPDSFSDNVGVFEKSSEDTTANFETPTHEEFTSAPNVIEEEFSPSAFTEGEADELSSIDSEANVIDQHDDLSPKDTPFEIDTFQLESEDINDNIVQSELKKTGGSYGELKSEGWGWCSEPPKEVHHMPADSSSNLERNDGPAIVMDYEDHKQTASCGSSRDAKEYREAQRELIDQGKFRDALQMDIDDLHEKFGGKYDDAIMQMLEYVDELEKSGKI